MSDVISLQPSAATPARPSRTASRLAAIARGAVLPLLLLLAWQVTAQLRLVNPLLLSRPAAVLTRAVTEVHEGDLFAQLFASLVRDLTGFGIGALLGVMLGGAMGAVPWIDRVVGPTFHASKQVAIFAWIPLLSVWFGNGESAKVVFIALAAFYPVVVNTYQGVRGVAREHVEVARVFRFTPVQLTYRVLLPSAAPAIFAGIQLGLFYAWLGTLGAEYLLAAGPGVGNLMSEGREQLAMDKVLLGVILTGAVGATLTAAAGAIERRALRWRVTNTQWRST
jgi:sulfonate transport system permease protein